jgi:hypothetical protein
LHGNGRAHKGYLDAGVYGLYLLAKTYVIVKTGFACKQHQEFIVFCNFYGLLRAHTVGGGVEQPALLY